MIKILKFRTPEKIAVIIPKLEQYRFTTDRVMGSKNADRMANSINPNQEQCDLGLYCLPWLSENLGSLR